MKSSQKSCERSEALLAECQAKIPGFSLYKRAVTTSSIYGKMPDGYGIRIGDHRGKEKYSYKYNLDPTIKGKGYWRKVYNKIDDREYWRYFSSSVDEIARVVAEQIARGWVKKEFPSLT